MVLLFVDLAVRFGARVIHIDHASAMTAVYLSLVLTVLVIPAGVLIGNLAGKFRS